MHADLETYWTQSESLKADLLARVAAMPEVSRGTPPKPGEWSPLQVLSHLLIAERFVVGYADTKGEQPRRPANPLVIGLLCRVMHAGIPLPAPDMMQPAPDLMPLETLAREWGEDREKLRGMLTDMPPGEPFGLHPYFGVVTTRQMMEMLASHMIYHVKRFPKPRA